MAAKKKTNDAATLDIIEIERGRLEFCVLGRSPLILNRMSTKAARELLMPGKKKNRVERETTLKHQPLDEFRASPYTAVGGDVPTRILMPATAFKGAMRSAAIDIPGAAKAQIGRLTYVEGAYVAIYGVPQLHMSITRSADMNRTPDVRSRAILPQWACLLAVSYVKPILNERSVANLLAAAGMIRGVGDWRTEKGAGDFGQFELVGKSDTTFRKIMEGGGREAQDAALLHPEPYDAETASLLAWFIDESTRRGFQS